MRILVFVGAVLAAVFAAPAMADPVCDQAKINLEDIRSGKDHVNGIPEGQPQMKGEKAYEADMAAFYIDAFREIGDIRIYCGAKELPAYVQPAAVKTALIAAVQAAPARYCSPAPEGGFSAVSFIQARFKDEAITAFSHRVKETSNSYDPYRQIDWDSQTHFSEASYLREVSQVLSASCVPNDEARLAQTATETAIVIAKENMAFVDCVKAREGYAPQIKAFDALVPGQDAKAMKAAYANLEKAAKPVKTACRKSEEGAKEIDYVIASKKMQIDFIEIPGCREAAIKMNEVRQSFNGMDKAARLAALPEMKQAGKDAKKACKNDPAPETWANFIAWIAEKNLSRLAN
ncbi:MAG: hypothetical protein QM773_18615 [Hyphomonadaceae bacterium]